MKVTVHKKSSLSVKQEMEMEGFHTSKTSVSYHHTMALEENVLAEIGDSLIVTVELIGGTTFKCTGMAFCSV